MKRYLHLIIYMAFLVLLGSCSKQPKKFIIGVSQCSEDVWRDKLNDELKTSEYLNDSIIVKLASSNDDNVLQNKQVNQFIDEGVDLLIISPNQLSAISKAVDRAHDKGIPVILYDRKTNSDKYTPSSIYCSTDSFTTFLLSELELLTELSTSSSSMWITSDLSTCSRGISTIKSDPFPNSLSTQTSP
jgi:ABC-type sugar transport system substrate-binding protein